MIIDSIYKNLIDNYSISLSEASKDKSQNELMTDSDLSVINFDLFAQEYAKRLHTPYLPMSCDALYKDDKNNLYLIEFKNGIIDNSISRQINRKVFESLLILLDKFDATINFSRKNMTLIIVYNEDINQRNVINSELTSLARQKKDPFNFDNFKKLYFMNVCTYSKREFEAALHQCVK